MGLWRWLTDGGDKVLERETGAVVPTLTSLITDWQTEQQASPYFSPHLIDRLWVARVKVVSTTRSYFSAAA